MYNVIKGPCFESVLAPIRDLKRTEPEKESAVVACQSGVKEGAAKTREREAYERTRPIGMCRV